MIGTAFARRECLRAHSIFQRRYSSKDKAQESLVRIERATEAVYEYTKPAELKDRELPKTPREWRNLVEMKILESKMEGAFDNLAGKGKPLKLDTSSQFADRTTEIFMKMLKEQRVLPDWIELRIEVDSLREKLLAKLEKAWNRHTTERHQLVTNGKSTSLSEDRWEEEYRLLKEETVLLNRQIGFCALPIQPAQCSLSEPQLSLLCLHVCMYCVSVCVYVYA